MEIKPGKEHFIYGGGITGNSAPDILGLDCLNGIGMGKASLDLGFLKDVLELVKNKLTQ